MRNSPISLVTGASYSTLQIYHRWVARWTFIHAFVHGMMWTILEYMQGPGYFTQAFEEWVLLRSEARLAILTTFLLIGRIGLGAGR